MLTDHKITPVNVVIFGSRPGLAAKLTSLLPEKPFSFRQMDGSEIALSGAGNSGSGNGAVGLPAATRIIIVDVSFDQPQGLLLCSTLAGATGVAEISPGIAPEAAPQTPAEIPIVALVGADDFATIDLALAAGATDFIMKPLNAPLVAKRLEVLLRHTHTHALLRHSAVVAAGRVAGGRDPLTGLPGADFFRQIAERKLQAAGAAGRGAAILLVNLDHFRRVQTILGKTVSEQLLARTANTIETAVYEFWDQAGLSPLMREDILIGRHGPDEFMILLPDSGREEDITALASFILARVSKPEDTAALSTDVKAYLTARIGITLFPADGRDIPGLVKNVESITHNEGRQGRGSYRFYTSEMRYRAARRFELEAELSQAMRKGDLKVHYQPEVDIRTGKISGAEALVRWQHPELGMLVPEAFIAVAEDVGLISEIGDWVLQQACLQCAEWHLAGHEFMRVSINISPYQFSRVNMQDLVWRALQDAQLPPRSLVLEMTESLVIEDVEKTLTAMRELKNMGVRLALDDFGTGYSSLSYLHSLAIDYLKIDRAFVKELPHHPGGLAVTEAIIRMAKALGLKIIAEGVESPAQLDCLKNLGCDFCQGYFFSPPLPASEMTALLRAGRFERRQSI